MSLVCGFTMNRKFLMLKVTTAKKYKYNGLISYMVYSNFPLRITDVYYSGSEYGTGLVLGFACSL